MRSLLISIVAVTFLGASCTVLASSSRGEATPLGMTKQLERSYSLARSDQDNFLQVHRYDNRRHKPHKQYRHGKPQHPKYSHGHYGHGKSRLKDYGHRRYGHGEHWNNRFEYRGHQRDRNGYRHGYSRDHHYNKYRDNLSIRLKFGSDGLVHYRSR